MDRRRLGRIAWAGGSVAAAGADDGAAIGDLGDVGTMAPPSARSLPMHVNSIALIAGKMATMGVGFLAWLVAARLFAPADVGLAAGAVSAMMLCVQLALFGAGAAIISLYPEHQRRPAALLDTALSFVAIASLAVAVGFLLLATGAFRELGVIGTTPAYTAAFLAMCVFGALGVLLDQISTALRRGDQALTRGALSGVVTLGALVAAPLLAGQTGAMAILAAWVAGNFAPVALGAAQLRRVLAGYRFRPAMRSDLTLRLIRVGLPNWALTLAERAPGSILPIVVTELLSPAANATWYAVWMMAWVVYIIPIQVGLSLFAEASHRPRALGRALRLGLALSLAIGVAGAVGAAIVGPVMLSFLGPTYSEGGTLTLR
ncbi:MAG TPA: oligosaccharide flippase family protein, partial [Thermomicrobiales bacterium]|nr:oligosaccharide flippase family protein [Thermomicrobiales bacterium]